MAADHEAPGIGVGREAAGGGSAHRGEQAEEESGSFHVWLVSVGPVVLCCVVDGGGVGACSSVCECSLLDDDHDDDVEARSSTSLLLAGQQQAWSSKSWRRTRIEFIRANPGTP